jgi:serine/threonine protein phosphatase PrpC
LSRAIGDFEFKQNRALSAEKQIVTVDPEIITHKLDGEEEFLVVACDGVSHILDLLSNKLTRRYLGLFELAAGCRFHPTCYRQW